MTNEEMKALAGLISANMECCVKEILTSEEAARYMGISLSHLYKMTMTKKIPYFKPSGKLVYFKRDDIEQWMQKCRVNSDDEAQAQAVKYCRKGGAL